MGLMRFQIHPPERITDEMVQQAYLSGIDRVAWPVRTSIENGMFSCIGRFPNRQISISPGRWRGAGKCSFPPPV